LDNGCCAHNHKLKSELKCTTPISPVGVNKTIKRLKTSMCLVDDGIPSFIIKGWFRIFVLLATSTFNLSVTSETFPSLWNQRLFVKFKDR
jgi:hypothetical protein